MKSFFPGGMERRILIQLLSREYSVEGPFGFGEKHTAEFDRLVVWTDEGYKDAFERVSGVIAVSVDKTCGRRYIISVDPRYNTEWVMKEIEAAAKCEEPQGVLAPSDSGYVYPGWQVDFNKDIGYFSDEI
jgi:hypothetical protein